MKIKLLISLALASAAYVGAMTCENDSCPVNQDSVQVNADSAQLSDPAQGYIFDRDIDGWIVNSCYSTFMEFMVNSSLMVINKHQILRIQLHGGFKNNIRYL